MTLPFISLDMCSTKEILFLQFRLFLIFCQIKKKAGKAFVVLKTCSLYEEVIQTELLSQLHGKVIPTGYKNKFYLL